jgi:hypothetical protein
VVSNCKGKLLSDGFLKIKETIISNQEKSFFKHPLSFDAILAGDSIEGSFTYENKKSKKECIISLKHDVMKDEKKDEKLLLKESLKELKDNN